MVSFGSQPYQSTTFRAPSSVVFNNSSQPQFSHFRPQEVNTRSVSNLDQPFQQESPRLNKEYSGNHYKPNRPIPESIIMELYRSQDRFGQTESETPTKAFGTIKRAESRHEDLPKKFESATVIRDNYPNTMFGQPNYEHSHMDSNLHAIQELSSEHLRHDNSASLLGQTSSRVDYRGIDPNDGKSSEEMMHFLRTYGSH